MLTPASLARLSTQYPSLSSLLSPLSVSDPNQHPHAQPLGGSNDKQELNPPSPLRVGGSRGRRGGGVGVLIEGGGGRVGEDEVAEGAELRIEGEGEMVSLGREGGGVGGRDKGKLRRVWGEGRRG